MEIIRASRCIRSVVLSAALIVLAAGAAAATPVKCQRAIVREATTLLESRARIAARCRERLVRGKSPCDGGATAARVASAERRFATAIGKACGGSDQVCGGDLTSEDTPAVLGWPATCPAAITPAGPECRAAITDCGDVARCLACVGEQAVRRTIDLAYGGPAIAGAERALVKCRAAIGAAAVKLLAVQATASSRCRDARLSGRHVNACPDPTDGEAVPAVLEAVRNERAAICRACGGADGLCDGSDDVPPAAIGFVTSCEAVTPPGGPSCARPIVALDDVAACVECVAGFDASCADPQIGAYPAECAALAATPTPTAVATPSATPTPTLCGNGALDPGEDCEPAALDGACPGRCAPRGLADQCTCPTGSFTLTAVAGAEVDVGWTGIAHDQDPIAERLLDGLTYGCSSGGPDRRCSYVADFVSAPFVGPPVPVSSGSVPVCVVREGRGRPSGILDLATGEFTQDFAALFHVHSGTSIASPCPICVGDPVDDDGVKGGSCSGGPSGGSPCDAQGITRFFGKTSLDCLPSAGSIIGDLVFDAKQATTGTKTVSTSAESPNCRGGAPGEKCFCDTCDDRAATPCSSNADCLAVGATRCGGRRCLGGANAGVPCAQGSECGGASCGRPGEPPKRNACIGGTCTPNPGDGTDPDDGLCADGPIDQVCSREPFRGCTGDAACNPPPLGDCPDCVPDQTCDSHVRECFLDPVVTRTGTPGIPSGVFAADFCLGPTSSSAVNSVVGLPGLGTFLIPYTLGLAVP